ncbi:MAG TPA: hypothetical protein VMT47_03345 [Polyangia bacterium]|nr:hypothetical protein [Polyangia bacterium]
MPPRRRRLAWTLGFAALVGCSSATPGDTPPTLSLDDLVGDLAAAACDWQVRCCSPLELTASMSAHFTTKEQCLPYARLELEKTLGVVSQSLVDGRVVIDPSEAMACLAAQRVRVCNAPGTNDAASLSFAAWVDGCASAFVGQLVPGRPCQFSAECTAGARCAFGTTVSHAASDAGAPSPFPTAAAPQAGVCLLYQKRGDVCQTDGDCAPEDYCRPEDLLCTARVAEGEPCPDAALFGVARGGCAAGLVCDGAKAICRRLPRDGETCGQFPTPCDPDPKLALFCVGTGFNGAGVCKTAGKKDDACGGSGLPPCGGNLVCDAIPGLIGACVAPPAAGSSCTTACASPAICDMATMRCTLPGTKQTGETCAVDDDCASLSCQTLPTGMAMTVCQVPRSFSVACSGAAVTFGSIFTRPSIVDGGTTFPADARSFDVFGEGLSPTGFDGGGFDAPADALPSF